jgi:hypothetical protein
LKLLQITATYGMIDRPVFAVSRRNSMQRFTFGAESLPWRLTLLVFTAAAVSAATVPMPVSLLGEQTINDFTVSYPIAYNQGDGGAFEANVGGALGSTSGPLVTLWCVDSQEDITSGTSYTANIVTLADVETSSTPVRYSGVTSGAANINATDQNPGTWDYDISSGSPLVATGTYTDYSTALERYELAAFLITQYLPSSTNPGPSDNATDLAIQRAIWEIMANDNAPEAALTSPTGPDDLALGSGDISSGVPAGYTNWIAYAEAQLSANPNLINLNQWAVVSGRYNGTTLNSNVQTFLVQLAPEPAYFAALGIGLAGLALAARRRRGARP